ncbi:MAG TPA: OB-fold domain-containing protein [Candidatus Thermoplasmatota archaeon]|nr:OB-fold domain-containing protein [Candidatus Thermoplasmatota archaeon]
MSHKPSPGILAMGVAVPRLRVAGSEYPQAWGHYAARGVEEKAVPAFDEDAVTLAAEAALKAVEASGIDPAEIGLVAFATSGADPGAAVVAEVVGARFARLLDVTGRMTAGLAALVAGFDSSEAVRNHTLVVAADVPRAAPGDAAEHPEGAGAAAFLIGPGGHVALHAAGAAAKHEPADRVMDGRGFFRSPEVGADRDALLAQASSTIPAQAVRPDFVLRFPGDLAVPGPDGKPLEGVRAQPDLRKRMGEAGAAQPLLLLAQALNDAAPGTEGLLVGATASTAQVLRLGVLRKPQGTGDVLGALAVAPKRISLLRAMQERGHFAFETGIPEEPMGAYVSLPAFAETLPARLRLLADRCAGCGSLQYPPRPACAECGGREFAPERLSGRGTVYACTIIGRGGAPSEFALQQALTGEYGVAVVELAEGPRVAAQIADLDPAALKIGAPLQAVVRRLYRQQGVTRYGVKFRVLA